jgi:uncharacterized protein (DUF433 family)
MRRSALPVVFVALALGGCTHMPWNPHRGWRSWKTANITIYTDTISEYEPALEWLDVAFLAYQSTFFKEYRIPPAQVLYMSAEGWSPFLTDGGRYKYGITVARLAWAEAHGSQGLVMVGNSGRQWPYHHQLAHHFIEAAVPRAPLWFQEGFASYLTVFQSTPRQPGVLCFGLAQPATTTRVTLPLKELLAASYLEYNQSSAPWIGPLAQSFIDYLLQGEHGRLRPRFTALMRALAQGKSGEQALADVYPEFSLAQLEAGFHAHVRTLRPPGEECPLGVPVSPMPMAKMDPVKTPIAEEEVHALFQGLEQVGGRDGYADFFPDPMPPAPKTTAAR